MSTLLVIKFPHQRDLKSPQWILQENQMFIQIPGIVNQERQEVIEVMMNQIKERPHP